jgi:hypothetical protein
MFSAITCSINGEKNMKSIIKILLFVFMIIFASTACIVPFAPKLVRGSGDITKESRDVSGFDEIVVTGAGTVIITQGVSESLTIETDDNLMKYIETEVTGNTLEIGFTRDTAFSPGGGGKMLEPSEGFVFTISVINLKAITLSGAARVEVDKLKTGGLDIVLSGAGDVDLDDLNADSLGVVVSGAGDVQVIGNVETQNVRLNGLGRYQAYDLKSKVADVTISGAGGAEVWVTEVLDVVISGAGDVRYYGDPSINPEISGLGRIQSQGEK